MDTKCLRLAHHVPGTVSLRQPGSGVMYCLSQSKRWREHGNTLWISPASAATTPLLASEEAGDAHTEPLTAPDTAQQHPVYYPPQKLLVPCASCGATVLRGLMVDGKIKKLPAPLTPIFGQPHVCGAGASDQGSEAL